MRRVLALLLAFLLLPAFAAPAPAAGAAAKRPGGRVVIGVRGDVSSFNIYTATNAFTQEVVDLLYLKLAEEQDDFHAGPPTFQPLLATAWELSPDGRSLTLHLDPAARWNDGAPITAADVLFSHAAATSPEVGWVGREVKEFITEVTAPDPHTVVYRFARAYPYRLMDAVEGNILPAAHFSDIAFPDWPKRPFFDAAAPSGPFVLKRYERGALIELARNPASPIAGRVHLDSVVFRILPDEATLVSELLSGGIDVMENLPETAVPRVRATPHLRIVRVPDLSYTFICWNTTRPWFADRRVRRALTLAIDRDAIREGLLPHTGRPGAGPILSSMWAFDPNLRPPPYDPEAARRLLAEAGWEDRDGDGILDRDGVPFRFELETNQGSSLRSGIVEMVAAQIRKVGVEAVPRILEFGAFVERHEHHEFDAYVGSWRESTKVDLKSVFHTDAREHAYNYGSYSDPDVDGWIDRAREEPDARVAARLWRQAQRRIVEDAPYTFLFERDRLHAVPRDLHGVRESPRSLYAGLAEWRWGERGKSEP